jgi:probable HAF family extracellular repeat protein
MQRFAFALLALISAGVPSPSQAATRYVITSATIADLGTLGGSSSVAYDINNSGHIAGWADNAAGVQRAFYYHGGVMEDIGISRGIAASSALGINNSGTVVGYWNTSPGTKAFRWTAGTFFPLNDRPPSGSVSSTARTINDAGIIAGQRTWTSLSYSEATAWQDDALFDPLHRYIFPYTTNVWAIAGSNYAVGRERETNTSRRWRWSYSAGAGSPSVIVPKPPGAGYGDNDALGVNDGGQVVGWVFCCWTGSRFLKHAYGWDGRSANAVDLGVLPGGSNSVAEDLNSGGFLVGYADKLVGGATLVDSAFIYHSHFGMFELPKLPQSGPCRAYALNELSASRIQVVGSCDYGTGTRAVRWNVKIVVLTL